MDQIMQFEAEFAKKKKDTPLIEIDNYVLWLEKKYQEYVKQQTGVDYKISAKHSSVRNIRQLFQATVLRNALYLKFLKSDYIVITFSLLNYETNVSFNYCIKNFIYINEKNTQNILYFSNSLGPSFVSEDGEYKNRFVNVGILEKQRSETSEQNKNLFSELEIFFDKLFVANNYGFEINFYYPFEFPRGSMGLLKDKFKKGKSDLLYFSLVWLCDMYLIVNKRFPNNINSKYHEFYKSNEKVFIQEFNRLYKNYESLILTYIHACGEYVPAETIERIGIKQKKNDYGTKTIPLSIVEIQNPLDIQYKPWRELLVMQALNSMYSKFVCKGFPLLFGWFLVNDSDKKMYDNPKQYERMSISLEAVKIVDILREAEKQTAAIVYKNSGRETKTRIASWLRERLGEVKDRIADPILFLKEKIIMSPIGINMIFEHVGYTFANALEIQDPIYLKEIGNIFTSSDKFSQTMFKRYMFDMCYNCACLNTILGAIHADLHLNNFTFRRTMINSSINSILNLHEVYYIGESKYYVPTVGFNICYIDFSRVIMQNDKMKHLQLKEYQFSIVGKKAQFREELCLSLLKIYINAFPDQSEQKNKIYDLIKNKFNTFLKLISPIDIYLVCQKILHIIKLDGSPACKHLAKSQVFLKEIQVQCRVFLIEYVNKFLDFPDKFEPEIEIMDWPMVTVIRKVFTDFLIKPDPLNCSDVFKLMTNKEYFDSEIPDVIKEFGYIEDGKEKQIPDDHQRSFKLSPEVRKFLTTKEKSGYESVKKTSARFIKGLLV